jgi:hypothetical protein
MANEQKPETALIQQLCDAMQALQDERDALLARVDTINQALGLIQTQQPKPPAKEPKGSKSPKSSGMKEAVLIAVTGTQGLTIKEIQGLLPEHPGKSLEATIHSLASTGQLVKDGSTPRRFSLPAPEAKAKTNGAAKTAGATV